MRIGLANLPILAALEFLQPQFVLLLILLKVIGQNLIHGTLFSYVFLFSLSGSFAGGLVMIVCMKVMRKYITLIGVSVFGALASNIVQILLARYLIFGRNAWLLAPAFLIVGTASSIVLGAIAQYYVRHSEWLRKIKLSWNTDSCGDA